MKSLHRNNARVLRLITVSSSRGKLDDDGTRGTIDCELHPARDELSGTWYANDCWDAVLAGHDSAMRHRSAHFHHQATGREEERRPAGVGRRSDQNLSLLQMSIVWIEDYSRGCGHDAWRGWRSL